MEQARHIHSGVFLVALLATLSPLAYVLALAVLVEAYVATRVFAFLVAGAYLAPLSSALMMAAASSATIAACGGSRVTVPTVWVRALAACSRRARLPILLASVGLVSSLLDVLPFLGGAGTLVSVYLVAPVFSLALLAWFVLAPPLVAEELGGVTGCGRWRPAVWLAATVVATLGYAAVRWWLSAVAGALARPVLPLEGPAGEILRMVTAGLVYMPGVVDVLLAPLWVVVAACVHVWLSGFCVGHAGVRGGAVDG